MNQAPALALSLGLTLLSPVTAAESPSVEGKEVLEEVWQTVREEHYDPTLGGIDWEEARARFEPRAAEATTRAGAVEEVNAMLDLLGTSHTHLYDPDDPRYHQIASIFWRGEIRDALAGSYPGDRPSYVGIGAFVETLDEGIFVTGVPEGTPAKEAGLLRGDRLISAGGEPYRGLASFRDREGRPMVLVVERRPGERLSLEVIPRLLRPEVLFLEALRMGARLEEIDGFRVGYAPMWSYAGSELHEELERLLLSGPLAEADALVLDLRGGWGGADPSYLSLFDDRLPAITMIRRGGERSRYVPRWQRPVVLLVDERTRSGKEILAWAFRRHGIGPVVGGRTAGAVLGGRLFVVAGDLLLYLPVADILVDGERLEGRGVEPDLSVPFELRWAAGDDPRRRRALEVAAEEASEVDPRREGPASGGSGLGPGSRGSVSPASDRRDGAGEEAGRGP